MSLKKTKQQATFTSLLRTPGSRQGKLTQPVNCLHLNNGLQPTPMQSRKNIQQNQPKERNPDN